MTKRAIGPGDLAHAHTRIFQERVSQVLAVIERAGEIGTVGVSYSGGKDSTVTLDLCERVLGNGIPAAFFDCGCELRCTIDMVMQRGAVRFKTQRTLQELCRAGGYWGYDGPELVDSGLEINFFDWLVAEPSYRFATMYDLSVIAMGLRAGESGARRMNARQRGELYELRSGLWHLCPLAFWTDDDVWAYIASRGLKYNAAYDRMAELGMPRKSWRVGILLGSSGARTEGRYAWLRQMYPAIYNELVAEFPKIGGYT